MQCLYYPPSVRPLTGTKVFIAGRLMWDGDGFLEIHPQRYEDIDLSPDIN